MSLCLFYHRSFQLSQCSLLPFFSLCDQRILFASFSYSCILFSSFINSFQAIVVFSSHLKFSVKPNIDYHYCQPGISGLICNKINLSAINCASLVLLEKYQIRFKFHSAAVFFSLSNHHCLHLLPLLVSHQV